MGASMLSSVFGFAQNEKVYEAQELNALLKGSKAQSALNSQINLTLSKNETASGQVNVSQEIQDGKTYIGSINGNNLNSFHLEVKNGELTGQSILQSENKAYEYFTKNGEVYAKEVNINDLICTEFEKVAASKEVKSLVTKASTNPYELESFPGAAGCVYIDFDGEYVVGSYWNSGNAIDAQPANFSDAKMTEVWEIASEDFRPFGINVTTSRAVFDSYPKTRRMQVIVTPTTTAAPGSGGVAYIGSFSWNNDNPCWVFNLSTKACGETVSHEVGHTLDLRHDGRITPATTYFSGHGDWAPIMGASFYDPVTHWSKGEYQSANNQEDDLSIITQSKFGVGYRVDQHGNNIGSATALTIEANDAVLAVNNNGIIETTNDKDFFSFTTTGGAVSLNFETVSRHGNLDILATIYNSGGSAIGTANGAGLNASYNGNLAAGTYYVSIDGTGFGDPLNTGYSDYSSLGYFEISGSIPNSGVIANIPPTVSITSPSNGDVFSDPATIAITAVANDADGTVTKVEFFSNGVKIGEDLTAPYTFNFSPNIGIYNVVAIATDNDGESTTSTTVSVEVEEEQVGGCTVAAWTSSSIYTGGDQASYNGILYQAKWWTQGAQPDLNSSAYAVWSVVGPCSQGNIAPQVSVTAPGNGSVYTAPATINISANASDADGSIVNVEFFINGTLVGSDASAPYNYSSTFTIGNYSVYAIAEDNNGAKTTSSTVSFTVEEAVNILPTVAVTSPANGSVFTDPAIVSIDADASDSDGSISKVDFYINGSLVSTDATAPYSMTSSLAIGTYTVYAIAEDNEGATSTSASVNFTVEADVNELPFVEITSPTNGQILTAGSNISVTANASDNDGNVTMVEFFVNGSLLGGDLTAPYSVSWNNLPIGTYDVFAIATDNENGVTTSSYINVTVVEETTCSAPEWQSSSVYVGGNQVSYNGILYQAKWWTKNNQPDQFSGAYDVWRNLGACAPRFIEEAAAGSSTEFEFNVYPNPSKGELNFALNESGTLTIMNNLGSVVFTQDLSAGVHNMNVQLNTGVYFVNFSNSNGIKTKSIVITK